MKTAITLSLLSNSPARPFVLGPDPRAGFRVAAELGYDAVEIFPPSLEALEDAKLGSLVQEFGIPVSTIGTGGGFLQNGWTLTHEDALIRQQARDYITEVIKRAADLDACAIIGSMQGRKGGRSLAESLLVLVEALHELSQVARSAGTRLFFEPLNRYESDLANTLDDSADIIGQSSADNLLLLADLFHMNIEETNLAESLRKHGHLIGHVHFVDSNRQVAGHGHLGLKRIVQTLREAGFQGHLAVEAFPLPSPLAAAKQAMGSFTKLGVR